MAQSDCRRWLRSNWLLILLLAICVTRLWLMPLPSSFWTDETGTVFVVEHPADPSLAVVPQVPASIYFALPRAAQKLFGSSEISYRLPSLLLMGITLFIIARLAARLIGPDAAWFAVFACLALSDFDYYAADARPYPLGICLTAASLYYLVDWLDTARWKPALLFLLFAALLWRVQLVFWAFYPVFLIYTLVRLTNATTRVGWIRSLLVYCLLGLALIPVALDALGLLHNGSAHSFASIPGLRSLSVTIPWKWTAVCVGLAALAGQFLKWRIKKPASLSALALIAAWWLWMPLCLFVFSRATGVVLYIPRYFSPALPGAALAVTAAAACWLPAARWNQAAIVFGIAALIVAGNWRVLSPWHAEDNWRQASFEEDFVAVEPDTPVLAVSPFIEAQPPTWTPEYHLPGFLYAPLSVYPLRGTVYPFPFIRSRIADQYAADLLRDTLLKHSRFIIYGAGRNTRSWVTWFSKRPELANWRFNVVGAQAVGAAVFEKSGS
jgi:Dolichyl-phosphate-mannose-protein mannosyltransferase